MIETQCCPLCGRPNLCAMAAGKPATECWCQVEAIPKALLEQLPESLRGQACICQACVNKYNAAQLSADK